ncbi:30S ribosomal protein S1, chloroplastic [Symbiodinium microadriaticum]|uniref:30S ribosomal protein S1, chloroplastic n=1 Tax=Symbiodinium microadriaticum TaxID=2951 RepID=A0A1Q9E9R5_SYMMI|nr:30S ribosomal protein S1, chloroplastic [Symbiodinium microadriaticum]CAE7610026.1 rpsA [Symbiodinium sp. KB8]
MLYIACGSNPGIPFSSTARGCAASLHPCYRLEYVERAWDLYHSRSGSDQTQLATAVHLRSGLTGSAYEAVRLLKHTDLMTEDAQKKPTAKGTQLLLDTLKEAIAAEQPVKINELFLNCFYSPAVWRRPAENMQQYIVRREQDFKRLEDVIAGGSFPENIRAMMLLLFGGLDHGEQNNVLASVGNTYDFKKIAHAMRMQYPQASGKPVVRRDLLGCSRSAPSLGTYPRPPKGYGKGRRSTVLVAETTEEEQLEDDGAGYDETYEATECDHGGQPENEEALATLAQKEGQAKGSQKGAATGSSQAFPFKTSGELSFDQRAKGSKRQAVQFLKSVTPCTACGQKGHWQGDDACPKKRAGKPGAKGKHRPAPKRPAGKTTYFVLHPDLEENDQVAQALYVSPGTARAARTRDRVRFSNLAEHQGPATEHEVYVNLRTNLCAHASSRGGRERNYHPAANSHTRSIMCKEPECNKVRAEALSEREAAALERTRQYDEEAPPVARIVRPELQLPELAAEVEVGDRLVLFSDNVLRDTMVHMHGAADPREGQKRGLLPGDMVTKRTGRVPVCMDPTRPDAVTVQDCEVMVQDIVSESSEPEGETSPTAWVPESFATAPENPPRLANLDSGCTRTMHGSVWAQTFEERLRELGVRGWWHVPEHRDQDLSYRDAGRARPFMHELGAVLDLGANTVSFNGLGMTNLPLVKTAKGHIAVNLLDFDQDKLDEFGDGPPGFGHVHAIFHKTSGVQIYTQPHQTTPLQINWRFSISISVQADAVPAKAAAKHKVLAPFQSLQFVPGWVLPEPCRACVHHALTACSSDSDVEQFPASAETERGELNDWMRETRAEAEEHEAGQWKPEGDVSEEFGYFSSTVNGDRQVLRRASSKKGKKLLSMSASVDARDTLNKHVLSGRSQPNHKPPYSKVWMKQVFAVHSGLSVLCVALGLAIGVPLDYTASGWKATTSEGRRQLHRDLRTEDPYLLVITPPCLTDNSWDIWRLTGARPAALTPAKLNEVQAKVLELVNKLVKERVEARRHVLLELPNNNWREDPAMNDVVAMLSAGELELLPRTRTSLLTSKSMVTAASVFGNGTADPDFDKVTCDTMVQQATVEQHVFEGVSVAFPAEVPPETTQGGQKRRRRTGRQAILTPQKEVLRDLHVQFGHPTNVTLQRILRRQGAKLEEEKAKARPTTGKDELNYHLSLDVFYAKDAATTLFAFLNIVCEAVLRHFLASWSSWAGRVEKAGGLWKEVFKKAVHEMQLVGLDDVILAARVAQVRMDTDGQVRNHRRAEDPELPTDGGQPHSYWLRYGAAVVSVTGEQLRFASDELLAAHTIPQEARQFIEIPSKTKVPVIPSAPVFGEPQIPILAPSPSGAPMTMGYAPVRPETSQAERPYFSEGVPFEWYCPTLPEHVREYNLKKFAEAVGESQEESENSEGEQLEAPADAFLTGKAVRSEIKLKDLNQEDRAKFDEAMAKEWSSWQKFGAVETLTPQQIAELPASTKIVGTRWVHTDKNQKPRLLAGHIAKKTGKSKSQLEKEYPFMPKSRLVVQGCQEEDDSPTASLLAFNLLCAIAVMQKWVIAASDASTVYLQSQGINRLLILRPPRPPPPPGVSPSDLFRAKGSIYGTKDAGRSWWKKLWVDDVEVQRGKFRFCGKNLVQKGQDIEVDQFDAIEGVDYMLLERGRRKQPNSPLTEEEKSQFRGLIGQMGWIVRQSRPDLMVNVSIASQTLGHPCVKDVVDLNKECRVACFADSSWANLDGLKSQCGYVVCLTLGTILDGASTPILILETYSGTIKRVCRSTLAAEANGFLTGVESAEYVRELLLEITNPRVKLIDIDRHYLKKRVLAFTDAKSLEEILGENLYDDEDASGYAIWVDTSQMLADVLTKIGCEREPLLEAMRTGQWRLEPYEEARLRKLTIRAGRQARKAKLKGNDDFLEETSGNKFDKEGWVAPEIGDTVSGTIMYVGEDGAFVELDCGGVKSWAQLPTKLASLKPISSVEEVNLEVGAKIETVVVQKDLTSVVLGDPTAVQYIVSLSSLELDAAWNKVQMTMDGEEGYDPLWQVQVLQMASWGAQVMTEEGLIGMIPARDLGEKAGDQGMVGAILTVQIKEVKPENRENTNPQMVNDYPIVFSYADVMKKVLAEKINEGDVVEAKITNFLPSSMDIEIEGIPFPVSKVDISRNTRFDPQELFVIDEIIKVYCMSSDPESGQFRMTMQTEAAGAPLALTWSWFSEKAHGTGYGGGQPDVATEAPLQNAVEGYTPAQLFEPPLLATESVREQDNTDRQGGYRSERRWTMVNQEVSIILKGTGKAYRVTFIELSPEGDQRVPGKVGHMLRFRQVKVSHMVSSATAAYPKFAGHKAAPIKVSPTTETAVLYLRIPEAYQSAEKWKQAKANLNRWVEETPGLRGKQLALVQRYEVRLSKVFRLVSALVLTHFQGDSFPKTWHRPSFQEAPQLNDDSNVSANWDSGEAGAAWAALSDWTGSCLGIEPPRCPLSWFWMPMRPRGRCVKNRADCEMLLQQASASLWKAVIHFGDVPRAWQRRATVVLLPKDQEDTRPMALLSMAWRSGARGHRPSRKELGGRLVRSQCVWICPWTIRVRNAPKNVLFLVGIFMSSGYPSGVLFVPDHDDMPSAEIQALRCSGLPLQIKCCPGLDGNLSLSLCFTRLENRGPTRAYRPGEGSRAVFRKWLIEVHKREATVNFGRVVNKKKRCSGKPSPGLCDCLLF